MVNLKQFVFLVLALAVSSCTSSNTTNISCPSCSVVPPQSEKEISLPSGAYTFDVYDEVNSKGKPSAYSLLISQDLSEREISKAGELFLDKESLSLPEDEHLSSFVIFVSKSSSTDNFVSEEEVKGAIIYSNAGGFLKARVADFKNSKYLRNLTTKPDGVSPNDFYAVSKIFTSKGQKIRTIAFINFNNLPKSGSTHNLDDLIEENFLQSRQKMLLIPDPPNEPGHDDNPSCKHPCDEGGGRCVASESGGYHEKWRCAGCIATSAETVVKENDGTWSVSYTNMLKFRDSILEGSSYGNLIIQDYYDLYDYVNHQNMPLEVALEGMEIYNSSGNNILEKLLHQPNSSDILYRDSVALVITNYLQEVKSLNNDSKFETIMDGFIQDINAHKGKTVEEVRAVFN
jgi:hypothetical protein